MPNIKFSYLYRDASNYKNFGFLVFENFDNLHLSELQALIQSKLIDGMWFYAGQWQLPDLHFNSWCDKTDHTFHEFESIEYTNEPPNTLITLALFKKLIEHNN
jgi:hypothetical protein